MTAWLQSLFWPEHIRAVVWITDWGGPLGWIIAVQLVFYLGGVRRGLYLGVLAVSTLLLNNWLKSLLCAPRPYYLHPDLLVHEATPGLGMPSGHAQGAAAIWIAIARFQRPGRATLAAALVMVLAIGLSRVILGVHSFAQVGVGWVLGFACLWLGNRMMPGVQQWFARRSVLAGAGVMTGLVGAGWLVTVLVGRFQADFRIPDEWQRNYLARAAADAEPMTVAALLAPDAAQALLLALAGFVLVGMSQRLRPVTVCGLRGKILCLLIGSLVTAALWWLMRTTGLLQTPFAWLVPLLYPLICGFLPLAITQQLIRAVERERHPPC